MHRPIKHFPVLERQSLFVVQRDARPGAGGLVGVTTVARDAELWTEQTAFTHRHKFSAHNPTLAMQPELPVQDDPGAGIEVVLGA